MRLDDEPVALSDPVFPNANGTEDEPEADGDVVWTDEPSAAETAPGPRPVLRADDLAAQEIAEQAEAAARRSTNRVKKVPGQTDTPADRQTETVPARPSIPLSERIRNNRNPLIFLAVAFVVVATVGYRTHRARVQDLPRIAELGRVEGLPALDAGKFDLAYQLLSEAKRAVISLGDEYQGSGAIRQGADEAAIITQLVPNSLEDLLDEASRADPKEWGKRFDTLYRGRSVIIDAHITSVPDGQGNGRYALDYRVLREGEGAQPRSTARVDLTGFRLIEQIKPKVGDRITLGARLGFFRFDPADESWLIGLEPESGVIMTHAKALEALGWPSEDAVPEVQP